MTTTQSPLVDLYQSACRSWRRHLIADRTDELAFLLAQTESAIQPFLDNAASEVVLGARRLITHANESWALDALENAELACMQTEGALIELKGIMRSKSVMSQFCSRVLS
jgi:hypothetical protein